MLRPLSQCIINSSSAHWLHFASAVVAGSARVHCCNSASSSKPELKHSCCLGTVLQVPVPAPSPSQLRAQELTGYFCTCSLPTLPPLHSELVTSIVVAHTFSPSCPSQPYLSSMAVLHLSSFSCSWSCTAFPHEGRRTGCLVRAVAEGLCTGSGWIMS